MKMRPERASLRALLGLRGAPAGRIIADAHTTVAFRTLEGTTRFAGGAAPLAGKSVLIRTGSQLAAALAAVELDGVARRILLCPPDLAEAHLPAIMAEGEVDVVVTDDLAPPPGTAAVLWQPRAAPAPVPVFVSEPGGGGLETEWVLFTSGTSGRPKLVVHTLESLTGPLTDGLAAADAVWSTFYDIRRYGGLQILLRAFLGGGSMILSAAGEPVAAFLARLGAAGATHVSGTPSHWRRALMSGAAARMAPRYVRLSGEIADQAILDRLGEAYPRAAVAHAFASTEAGVAFDVRDGLAGFPAAVLAANGAPLRIRIEDGTLRIRSTRIAARYLGAARPPIADAEGFVDTGDVVELRDGRYHFMGRREGVVNVGGQKIHPEEVERVINRHPDVLMSRVWGRPSPITGTLVAADVVLHRAAGAPARGFPAIRSEIVDSCRGALAAYKVPVSLREVAEIPVLTSGKISRRHA